MLDDNRDVLEVVKEALSYEQFEVTVKSDTDDIMEYIAEYAPDLLMLDYKLSGLRGDDICRQVKAHPKLNNVPVIICSAYLNKDDMLSCGCDAIISKPFGLDELISTITGLLAVE